MDKQLAIKTEFMVTAVPSYRLQVWHYSTRRRNFADNGLLSQFLLSNQDLKGWVPRAVKPAVSEQVSGDKYFPLEVDLVFSPPKPKVTSRLSFFKFKPKPEPKPQKQQQLQSDPISDLVEIFFNTLSAVIKEYFKARPGSPGEPHHLVLFPHDNNLPKVTNDDNNNNPAHILVLKSLSVSSETTTVQTATPPGNVPEEICRSVVSLVDAASLGTDTASLIIQSCEDWKWGKTSFDVHDKIRKRWGQCQSGGHVMKGEENGDGELTAQEALSREWTRAEERLGLFMQVVENMEHIVDCISRDSNRREISPQNLYEAMIIARNASIVLSEYQKQMLAVTKKLVALKADQSDQTKLSVHAGIICVALVLAWFTGGVSLAIGSSAAGLAVTNEIYHRCDTSSHKDRIKDLNHTITQLDGALADADAALAILFCTKVLRKPLDSQHISLQERRTLLRELGVDTAQLNEPDFSPNLVDTRIRQFCRLYRDFKKKTEDLKMETGFDTHMRRTGSFIEVA